MLATGETGEEPDLLWLCSCSEQRAAELFVHGPWERGWKFVLVRVKGDRLTVGLWRQPAAMVQQWRVSDHSAELEASFEVPRELLHPATTTTVVSEQHCAGVVLNVRAHVSIEHGVSAGMFFRWGSGGCRTKRLASGSKIIGACGMPDRPWVLTTTTANTVELWDLVKAVRLHWLAIDTTTRLGWPARQSDGRYRICHWLDESYRGDADPFMVVTNVSVRDGRLEIQQASVRLGIGGPCPRIDITALRPGYHLLNGDMIYRVDGKRLQLKSTVYEDARISLLWASDQDPLVAQDTRGSLFAATEHELRCWHGIEALMAQEAIKRLRGWRRSTIQRVLWRQRGTFVAALLGGRYELRVFRPGGWVWEEGDLDSVLASVPDGLFAAAVEACN